MNDTARPHESRRDWSSWRNWGIFLVFIAIIGYLFANGHTIHVLSALPFLIFLACPLMHVFMHHGDHGSAAPGSGRPQVNE